MTEEPQTKAEMDYDMSKAEREIRDMEKFAIFGTDIKTIKKEYMCNPLFNRAIRIIEDIQKHTIDRQRVRKIIKNRLEHAKITCEGFANDKQKRAASEFWGRRIAYEELLKEMGLEE